MRFKTALNSPCEPVQTTAIWLSGNLTISSIFIMVSLGILIVPERSATSRFWIIENPANATLRPCLCASSKINCKRCTCDEKQLKITRLLLNLSITWPMEYWMSNSVCVCVPADSQLVDSFINIKIPSFEATSVSRSRSNFWPSTGLSSNRQSPESTITPIGVRIITAVESGIEWLTRTNSIEKYLEAWTISWLSGSITR